MLKSLYSGVSGMKGFQTKLDVIGNNISNVNTIGFKKSRVMFQDIINQNIAGATAPTAQSGGINPKQVGLGTKIGAIDTIHTPGSPMTTGVGTDLAIDGDAFFVVTPEAGGANYLTKAGNFTRDALGNLVNSNGFMVNGISKDQYGAATQMPVNINTVNEVVQVDDGNGGTTDQIVSKRITSYSIDANGFINIVDEGGNIGKLALNSDPNDPLYGQYYLNAENSPTDHDNISLATAVVANPNGLNKIGNTMYMETGNSGAALIGRIEDNSGGQINAGVLEMSNVDLTEEFTEMIIAQRGFQANSRTITTSDSILEEVVNLKR